MTPKTMLAAVYQPGNQKLVFDKHYPIRDLADNEVLLKVAAAGGSLCHTDVALLSGFTLDIRKYILGHEACGTPVKLGSKVDANVIQEGKFYSVLALDSCTRGLDNQPVIFNSTGLGRDGAYAEYLIATEDTLVPVPDNVPHEVAAIASDAGITAYKGVHHAAQVKPGDKVLIFGIGGLGHLAVQYAKHLGATVYACDFKPAARELALRLGATEAFDLIELTDKTNAGFTVDTTIDFVATNQTFNLAIAALKGNAEHFPNSNRCVLIGASSENLVFNTFTTVGSGIQIITSEYGQRNDLVAVLDLFAKGIIKAVVHSEPLENVNKVIDELRSFEITGRKVVIPHQEA